MYSYGKISKGITFVLSLYFSMVKLMSSRRYVDGDQNRGPELVAEIIRLLVDLRSSKISTNFLGYVILLYIFSLFRVMVRLP